MKFDLKQAREHIKQLAKKHKVKVHNRRGRRFSVSRVVGTKKMTISVRPVKSIVTYTENLLAFGYILGKWQSKPRLYRVAGAWKWAKENSVLWTDRMNQQMEKNLLAFWKWQTKHKTMVLPDPDHEFWQLLSEETAREFQKMLDVEEVMQA